MFGVRGIWHLGLGRRTWFAVAALCLLLSQMHCFPRDFSGLPCVTSEDCAGIACIDGWCGGVRSETAGPSETTTADGSEPTTEQPAESVKEKPPTENPPEPRVLPEDPPALVCAKKGSDQKGEAVWALSGGGKGTTEVYTVRMDAQGNVYIAGTFEETLSFGSTTLTSQGFTDIFVAKLDSQGCVRWAFSVGGGARESTPQLWVEPDGSFVLAGNYSSSSKFQPFQPKYPRGVFLVRWSSDRQQQWTFAVGTSRPSSSLWMYQMAANTSGFALTGYYTGSVEFSPDNQVTRTAIKKSTYALRVSSKGAYLWVATGAAEGEETVGNHIAMDAQHQVYVVGEFAGTLEWKGAQLKKETVTSRGLRDAFLVAFDSQGKLRKVISWGGAEDDIVQNVATYQYSVFATGTFKGTMTFGSTTLGTNGSSPSIFALKLDNALSLLQHQTSQGAGSVSARRVALTADGNAYISDGYSGRAVLGGTTLTAKAPFEPFVWSLDRDLKSLSAVAFPATKNTRTQFVPQLRAMMSTSDGSLLLVGGFPVALGFGSTTLTSSVEGNQDFFVVKYKP
ncbi:MAG: hypothetical protein EP343_08220 [Deltaproteobacteria bacterium]|nr:MAG: hypothetical protein EP343_08220 [Deltaproteobacteria bacterium]